MNYVLLVGVLLFVVAVPSVSALSRSPNLRRKILASIPAALVIAPRAALANSKSRSDGYSVQQSDDEWHSILSPSQYYILRDGGTERPNSSILESEERSGVYSCAGCKTDLFESSQKFHSGTGWVRC